MVSKAGAAVAKLRAEVASAQTKLQNNLAEKSETSKNAQNAVNKQDEVKIQQRAEVAAQNLDANMAQAPPQAPDASEKQRLAAKAQLEVDCKGLKKDVELASLRFKNAKLEADCEKTQCDTV